MKPTMHNTIMEITNIFAGGDGGVNFLKFKVMMENFEKQALEGDFDAAILCDIVYKFRELLMIANIKL